MHLTITWTYIDPDLCCHMVSLGHNELKVDMALPSTRQYFKNLVLLLVDWLTAWSGFSMFNTLRQKQDGRHFPDDIFNCIFLNEKVWILIKISLKFVPKGPINNIPSLVQIMAWRRPGDKPLSEPMMVCLPTHICVTRPQWVKLVLKLVQDWQLFWLKFELWPEPILTYHSNKIIK